MLENITKLIPEFLKTSKIGKWGRIVICIFWQISLAGKILFYKGIKYSNVFVWLSPESIKYAVDSDLKKSGNGIFAVANILGGDWDLQIKKVDNMDFFIDSRAHYLENIPWDRTAFYHRVSKEIKAGIPKFSCKNINEWNLRLEKDDELYHNIRQNGYKSQKELRTYRPWDEVRVCLDRNGEWLFFDGRHRLAIARILGIKKIPVIVTYIHKEWYQKYQQQSK